MTGTKKSYMELRNPLLGNAGTNLSGGIPSSPHLPFSFEVFYQKSMEKMVNAANGPSG